MSYTNAIFYLDYENGSDTARTALTGCVASNPSGTITRINKTGHGLVTGAVVDLTLFTTWLNAAWKITWVDADNFDLDGAVWQATADPNGTVTPRGGMNWADAWKTISSTGTTSARIAPGDVIRIARSPAPVGMANAQWTNQSKTVTLQDLTSCAFANNGAGLVQVTKAAHNLTTGDVVTVSGSTDYDGDWTITVVSSSIFTLNSSTYAADRSGTVTPNLTKTITNCEADWTADHATSAAKLAAATDAKEGSYCLKMVEDASPSATERQAWTATSGTLDLSKYQKISFWLKNEVAITVGMLVIELCDNNDGTGNVDTFAIPAIPSAGQWIPLTIAKSGGGNLQNDIKSIRICNGAAGYYTASKYIHLDNVIACTTNGLNLQSLISKNSAEQGGNEAWLGLQSIVGNTLLLDNHVNCKVGAGRGYSGTTEIAPTYRRETIKLAMAATSSSTYHFISQKAGTASAYIEYQFGWNTSTTEQTGESIFDGLNGHGYFLKGYATQNLSYQKFNRISAVRCYRATEGDQMRNCWFDNIFNCCNNSTGLGFSPQLGDGVQFTKIWHCCNNDLAGLSLNLINSYIPEVYNVNSNISIGLSLTGVKAQIGLVSHCNNNGASAPNAQLQLSGTDCIIGKVEECNDSACGLTATTFTNATIDWISFTNNGTRDIYAGQSYSCLKLRNAICNSAPPEIGSTGRTDSSYVSITNYNQTGEHRIDFVGATITSTTNTRVGGAGKMYEASITSANRNVRSPFWVSIAKVAVKANKAVTISAYVQKDHATDVACQLFCRSYQLPGVPTSNTTVNAADSTDWQQITLDPITPTIDGVLEFEFRGWYVNGNSTVRIADLSITQAA